MTSSDSLSQRVKRASKFGSLECDHCGGKADSTLRGEHIWKCSIIVPKSDLRQLVDEWRSRADYNREVGQRHDANQIDRCADELEELIDR